ncbi:MAG TPA: UrcA family protein [Gammaproteobacteria bacterium]
MDTSKLKWSNGVAAALVASLVLSQAAFAAGRQSSHGFVTEPVTRTIDVRGLALTSPEGAARLYRQIVAAANRICRHSSSRVSAGVARTKVLHSFVEPCIADAVGDALAQYTAATGRNLEQVAGIDSEADLRASR